MLWKNTGGHTNLFDSDKLRNVLGKIDNVLSKKCIVVGVGGTAMMLHNLKTLTHDVDFTVRDGHYEFQKAINILEYCNDVETWIDGEIYLNTLPNDYFQKSTFCYSLQNLDVYAADLVDVIVTKIGRLNNRDVDDIEYIIRSKNINPEQIANRAKELKYDGLAATYFDNLKRVMQDNFGLEV